MSGIIDLSHVPAPACVTTVNMQAELDYLLDLYTVGLREQLNDSTFPRPLYSDPAYQILSTVAYRLGLQRQGINDACHATMLAYAIGSDLDQIGATFSVQRLTITPADNTKNPPIAAVMESDSRFRSRIQMALESWTTAGSRGSYEYHVLTASPLILDVFVDRPSFTRFASSDDAITLVVVHDARLAKPIPGDVALTLLLDPSADKNAITAAVMAALDPDSVIPLTDNINLLEPDIINYEVQATLYCYPGPSPEPMLSLARKALEAYTLENYRLGHDIAVSGLHSAAHQAGVQRVSLNLKDDIVVQPWQAAKCKSISVQLGGRDV